jgi:aspartyl-tRNA(Asn)/glutamyl-tRNA(Gln) amidotransferase subunit C
LGSVGDARSRSPRASPGESKSGERGVGSSPIRCDGEADRLATELEAILSYAEQLSGLDTSEVEPTSHPIELPTPLRDDLPEPALAPELALANAPEREGFAFVVPKVIEGVEGG